MEVNEETGEVPEETKTPLTAVPPLPKEPEPSFKPGEIFKIMPKVMGGIAAVEKKYNKDLRYETRSIDDVYNSLCRVMAKEGMSNTFDILAIKRRAIKSSNGKPGFHIELKMNLRFWGSDGSYVDCKCVGEGMDYGDKGIAKCVSIAHKTALLTTFLVPTKDMVNLENDKIPTGNSASRNTKKPPSSKNDQAGGGSQSSAGSVSNAAQGSLTDAQRRRMWAIAKKNEWSEGDVKIAIKVGFGIESTKDLTKDQYDTLCGWFEKNDPPSKIDAEKEDELSTALKD